MNDNYNDKSIIHVGGYIPSNPKRKVIFADGSMITEEMLEDYYIADKLEENNALFPNGLFLLKLKKN